MPIGPSELQSRFNVPGLTFAAGEGGLTVARVRTELAEADVYLHGAHVTHYRPGDAAAPVLFLSRSAVFAPDKAIRGGIPICFPWFGGGGPTPGSPAHGFARTSEWALTGARRDGGDVVLTLSLEAGDATRPLWPFAFRFDYTLRVGRELHLSAQVTNTDDAAFDYELALHTYLRVGDVRDVVLRGLAGCEYVDQLAGDATFTQAGEPAIDGEIDRIYQGQTADVTATDPLLRRAMTVQKSGGDSTILWNPHVEKAKRMSDFGDDEWKQMLCVESAAVRAGRVALAAGASHALRVTLSASGLSGG